MSQAFFMSGRTLKDWRKMKKTPPPDVVTLPCLNCAEQCTISAEGGRTLLAAIERGDSPAGVLCGPCLAIIAVLDGARIHLNATKAGAELVETTPEGKAIFDFMMDMGAKP